MAAPLKLSKKAVGAPDTLLWVLLVLLAFHAFVRLLLAAPPSAFIVPQDAPATRKGVGLFLMINGALIASLWLSVILPPILSGTLYPVGLAHFTTMIVQGFDLALFLPPSILAGYWYLKRQSPGELLAPVYAVFLSLQMMALLAKLLWMRSIGVSAGPALVMIPLLLLGAVWSAAVALARHRDPLELGGKA